MKPIKKILLVTAGGDCPGLNSVIRSLVKSAYGVEGWEVWGSKRAFCGILEQPQDLVKLTLEMVAGIHVKGGTILQTTNKNEPFNYVVKNEDGTSEIKDRSDELISLLKAQNFYAVVIIGGDGSQTIAQKLYEKGLNVVGVPKTIDNDLNGTDLTFGFQTAVEVCTEAVDKLVSTAESHNRVIIAEVMGRDAGWIALSTAVASGAEIVLIPEIHYDINLILEKIRQRIDDKNIGFVIIIIAEGAKPKGGSTVARESDDIGYQNPLLGGVGYQLLREIKEHLDCEVRVSVLGHIQRGGVPGAFDRVLAAQMGVKAFDLVREGNFGQMVSYNQSTLTSVSIKSAISIYNKIGLDNFLIKTARNIGICLGD